MVPLIDHYEVLGVPSTASTEDLKTAFRQAALRHHPDKAGTGNETKFLKIQNAWDVLGNNETRAVYDLQRAAAEARAAVHITDTILVDDMEGSTTEEGEAIVSWPCRCGGVYAALEEEISNHLAAHQQEDRLKREAKEKGGNDIGKGGEHGNGDSNSIDSSDEIVVPCSTCSLHILVVLNKPL